MTWTPTYNSDYTKLMIRQMMAFVQRDQRAALDWVGGADVLPSIQTFQLSMYAVPQFPAIMIAPEQSQFAQEAVGSRHSVSRIYVAVAQAHQQRDVLAEQIQDYVRALDAIFMHDDLLPDFYASWPLPAGLPGAQVQAGVNSTTPLAVGTVKELFVSAHRYDEIRRVAQGFAMVGVLDILIDREES